MKKFFSLVLALVMALSLTTVAWGATPVTTVGELEAATGEITVDTAIAISDDVSLSNVTITVGADGMLIAETNGTLTLGEGVVINAAETAIKAKGGAVIIDGATITCNHDTYAPVTANEGGTVTVKDGSITAKITAVTAEGTGAKVIIDGGTLTASAGSTAIAKAGGVITVNDGVLNAPASRALVAMGGAVTVNDGTVEGIWAYMDSASSATVNDGTLTWKVDAKDGANVTINGGTFNEPVGADTTGATLTIKGGTFATAPAAAYVAPGYSLNTTTGVVAATAAGGAADSTLYFWDNAEAKWLVGYIATGDDLDDLKQGADENCLPCYLIDGEYFVETTANSAIFKLVYGAKTVYLTPVDSSDVCYVAKASALTVVETADAECGDYHTAVVGLKDVFYVSYNPKTGAPTGFYKADKTSDDNVLVNGKLVAVEILGDGVVAQLMHDWVGYDVVNYQYTTVKCSECGKVAKLYANAEAAGKKAQPVLGLGYITFADYMDFGANAPVVTGKVESAETFDAGIAMYVGMSIMAATGSAVVIGKKKD